VVVISIIIYYYILVIRVISKSITLVQPWSYHSTP